MLDDRALAGSIAGRLFTTMSYIGLVSGGLLLLSVLFQQWANFLHSWRAWILIVMLIVIVIGQFVLQPMMASLKAAGLEGEVAARFGRLHGIASVLFMINSVGGLTLVIFGMRAAQGQ
jgi:hypothetical protein